MNKFLTIPVLLFFSALVNTSCKKVENDALDISNYTCIKLDTITFPHSIKGWELYSWPVNSSWKYSLLVGTNATKTYVQVIDNKISVIGEDSLKLLLKKLPNDEELMWIGKVWLENSWQSYYDELQLPPKSIQIEIKEFCDTHNLKLTIVD